MRKRTARKSTYTLFVIVACVTEKLGRESKRKTNTLNCKTIVMQFNDTRTEFVNGFEAMHRGETCNLI